MCCQATVSDLLTDLGSNVTINCDLDENDVYWILLKTADPPIVILRSFSTPVSPFYTNKTLIKKYSVQFKHRLVINNVTVDELGVYYCMNTRTPPKLGKSTRIYITESTQLTGLTGCHNITVTDYADQTHWQIITIILGLMNGLLIIVVVGLVKVFVVGNRRSAEQLDNDLQQMQVTGQHQDRLYYTEVIFSKLRRKIWSSQINSTYAALNLPRS
ncbi:Ig kappa chain V region 3368 [Labeo rohita]|uniref:Ig kappa chain V region 3368 n=1 Tax=Labeo rohita TaxID=84645 RepID=A0ABQ8L8B5_LABRO|nr:Ig kappa chain V region 3368 [Labeo rohita]